MPAPKTRGEIYDVVRRSGLVDPGRLEEIAMRVDLGAEDVPQALQELVAQGLITTFHARQLLKGRYRGFALGKYLVLEQLGEGGMGKVFLCVHMIMRRLVAIKILSRELASDPGTVERFQREARAVAALDHPNIVRAHDMDQEGDVHFIVMEYVDGISLHDLVRKRGPLDVASACHYVRQAAIGLQQVMENRMIHRDIKPGNLLLDRRGTVKILDLGLARFSHEKHGSLTQKFDEGSVLGTADYLAPEQAMDSHRVDIRADIYSLGATIYFLLSGKPPFEGGSVTQKLLYHQMHNPTSLRKLRPDLPAELVAIVEKMMAKDPQERFQTPHEVVYALEPWTRTPLPLPREEELPRQCVYVQKAAQGDLSTSLAVLQSATTVAASGVRMPAAVGAGGGGGMMSDSYGSLDRDDNETLSNSGSNSQAKVRLSDASFPGRDPSGSRVTPPVMPYAPTELGSGVAPSTRRRRGKAKRTKFVMVLLGSAALVTALVFYFAGGSGAAHELIVSQTATGPNVYKSLREAWEKRDPNANGTIHIEDAEIREQLHWKRKGEEKGNWRIMARLEDNKKKVKWMPPAQATNQPLLRIDNLPGLTLFNIEFDGNNQLDDLVVVRGKLESLSFTTIDFRGMRQSGLKFVSCNVSSSCSLSYLNFLGNAHSQAFIVFESEGNEPNRNLELSSLTLNGLWEKRKTENGIVISGPMDRVTFMSGTYSNLRTAILFQGVLAPRMSVNFRSGNLNDNEAGIRFENLPVQAGQNIVVSGLTFTRTKRMAMIGTNPLDHLKPEPPPSALANMHWIWSNEGNPVVSAPAGIRYFRTTFNIAPSSASNYLLDLVCDDTCKAYFNGVQLQMSDASGDNLQAFPLSPTKRRVYTVNVSQWVQTDKPNVLAIEASSTANTKPGPRGLLVRLTNRGTGQILMVSDDKWHWTAQTPPNEWIKPEFKGTYWQPVKQLARYHEAKQKRWSQLLWDSELQNLFKGAAPWSIVQLTPETPNRRDIYSDECYPLLEAEDARAPRSGR